MRPLFALAVASALCAPAAAQPQHPLLSQCLANETGVRRWYHALSAEERTSFNALYSAYADNVRKRGPKGDGWSHGWLGNFWTNYSNDVNANGAIGGLFKTATTWTDSRTKLEQEALPEAQREYGRAKAAVDAAPGNPRLARDEGRARERLENLQELASRQAGTCSDWAADTRDAMSAVDQPHFKIETEVRVSAKAFGDSGSHIYAKVCRAGADCLIFDPWKRGYPELATAAEQARGASNANSCFSIGMPVE